MDFIVQTRATIPYYQHPEDYVVISISDTNADRAEVYEGANLRDILFMKFDDIDVPHPEFMDFTDDQARQIIQFYLRYKDETKAFVIHCNAGMSRSPGVAAALQRIHTGEDDVWFRTKTPNRLVYRRTLGAAAEKNLL